MPFPAASPAIIDGGVRGRGMYRDSSPSFKENLNASRPFEHPIQGENMSKRLGGIIDCKDKNSSWYLNGIPDGSNIGSTV